MVKVLNSNTTVYNNNKMRVWREINGKFSSWKIDFIGILVYQVLLGWVFK